MSAQRKRLTPQQIRHVRECLRLSAEAFAKCLGVTEATVTGWERGDAYPSRAALQKMADMTRAAEQAAAAARSKARRARRLWFAALAAGTALALPVVVLEWRLERPWREARGLWRLACLAASIWLLGVAWVAARWAWRRLGRLWESLGGWDA